MHEPLLYEVKVIFVLRSISAKFLPKEAALLRKYRHVQTLIVLRQSRFGCPYVSTYIETFLVGQTFRNIGFC